MTLLAYHHYCHLICLLCLALHLLSAARSWLLDHYIEQRSINRWFVDRLLAAFLSFCKLLFPQTIVACCTRLTPARAPLCLGKPTAIHHSQQLLLGSPPYSRPLSSRYKNASRRFVVSHSTDALMSLAYHVSNTRPVTPSAHDAKPEEATEVISTTPCVRTAGGSHNHLVRL